MDWSFFDGIYCINLINQTERLDRIKKIFNTLNIKVEFFQVNRHVEGPVKGCFESHIGVINKALRSGYNNILIFEDDVVPYDITQVRLDTITDFMKGWKWDIFYFGAIPDMSKSSNKIIDKIYSVKTSGTHAYALPIHTMLKLKNSKFTGEPIDDFYKRTIHESYAIYPSMFYPGTMKSNISNVNAYERFPKIMHTINKIKEGYAYHIGIPIYILALVLVCFAIIIFLAFRYL